MSKPTMPADWRSKLYRVNVYVCPENHASITVDVDEGVTPFITKCLRPGCEQATQSRCYPTERPIPDFIPEPSHEWFKPKLEDCADYDRDHVSRGGLILRPRTDKLPLLHAVEKAGGAS